MQNNNRLSIKRKYALKTDSIENSKNKHGKRVSKSQPPRKRRSEKHSNRNRPTAPPRHRSTSSTEQKKSNINLNIIINEAKGLKKNQQYCTKVSVGSIYYKTKEIQLSHPKWNETFSFALDYANYIIITLTQSPIHNEQKIDFDHKIKHETINMNYMIHFRDIKKYTKLTWISLSNTAKLRLRIHLHSSSKLDLNKYKTQMNNVLMLCRHNDFNLIIKDISIKKPHDGLEQSTTSTATSSIIKSHKNNKIYIEKTKTRFIEYPIGSEKVLIILSNVNIVVNDGMVKEGDVILTSYRLIIRYSNDKKNNYKLSFQILFGLILKLEIKQKRVNPKTINISTGRIRETSETRKKEKTLGYKMKDFMKKVTMDENDMKENIFFRNVLRIRTKTGKLIEIASKNGYKRDKSKSNYLCCNTNKQSIAIYEMSIKILNTFNSHNILFPISTNFRQMSAYNWCNYNISNNKKNKNNNKIFNPFNITDWIYEFETRQKISLKKWRKTNINNNYQLCETYPQIFYVPYNVSDELCINAAKFRSKSRMVVLDYYNALNGNVILRCAQPMRGIMNHNNEYDIKYINKCRETAGKNTELIFFDCRSEAAAQANRFRGKGTEKEEWYGINTKIIFLDIPNIHVIRNSFDELLHNIYKNKWHSKSNTCKWNKYIESLISGSILISKRILNNNNNIVSIIHCSDGWDRTSQLCSLTQILIDKYCRTINGFVMIIEKEWLSFGHKFKDRNGFFYKKDERSPIFFQFIECVYNLLNIFPNEFEFNIQFLVRLAKYYQTYWFGNFLFNSQKERKKNNIKNKCVNIWSWKHLMEEININYKPKIKFLYITNIELKNKIKPLFFEYFNLKYDDIKSNSMSNLYSKDITTTTTTTGITNHCQDCNTQFTLFKKRIQCNNCKKSFCNKCLHKIENNNNNDDDKLYQCYSCGQNRNDRLFTI